MQKRRVCHPSDPVNSKDETGYYCSSELQEIILNFSFRLIYCSSLLIIINSANTNLLNITKVALLFKKNFQVYRNFKMSILLYFWLVTRVTHTNRVSEIELVVEDAKRLIIE